MEVVMVGVGEIAVRRSSGVQLNASGLGSCIALILIDAMTQTVGMAHIALPDSEADRARDRRPPGYYADTGVPALINAMIKAGAGKNACGYAVKLAGGSRVMDPHRVFNIGARNREALGRLLQQRGMKPAAEDVGGTLSRTVRVTVDGGQISVTVSSPGRRLRQL